MICGLSTSWKWKRPVRFEARGWCGGNLIELGDERRDGVGGGAIPVPDLVLLAVHVFFGFFSPRAGFRRSILAKLVRRAVDAKVAGCERSGEG